MISNQVSFLLSLVLIALSAGSCTSPKALFLANSSNETCIVALDLAAIVDSDLRSAMLHGNMERILLAAHEKKQYTFSSLSKGRWSEEQLAQLNASVDNVMMIGQDTLDFKQSGFSYDGVFTVGSSRRSQVAGSCPLLVKGATGDSADLYFPMGVFADTSLYVGRDTFVNEWYSKHLRAMGEPRLAMSPTDQGNVLRFLWLRTFHKAVTVRVNFSENGARLTGKVLTGQGGYEPGDIEGISLIDLTGRHRTTLLDMIDECGLYDQPTIGTREGLDGAQWIFELRVKGRYHVIDRWSPEKEDCVRRLGELLIGVSDLGKVKPIY